MEGSQDEQGVSADNSKPVCDETQQLKELIASLEDKLDKKKLINQITDNDKMTKFYTGIKSWKLFLMIYRIVLPGIFFLLRKNPKRKHFLQWSSFS